MLFLILLQVQLEAWPKHLYSFTYHGLCHSGQWVGGKSLLSYHGGNSLTSYKGLRIPL